MAKRASERDGEGDFRDLIAVLPIAAYTTDENGFVTSFNQDAVEFAGRTPELGRDRWCVSWRLYWPNGRPMPHEDCPMAVALRENRCIRGLKAIAERPNGSRIWFQPYPTPVRNTAGLLVGGFNVLTTPLGTSSDAQRSTDGGFEPNSVDRHVGAQLRLRRGLLRLSQEQVAHQLGTNESALANMELGLVRISLADLMTLSQILRVKVSWFFDHLAPDTPKHD